MPRKKSKNGVRKPTYKNVADKAKTWADLRRSREAASGGASSAQAVRNRKQRNTRKRERIATLAHELREEEGGSTFVIFVTNPTKKRDGQVRMFGTGLLGDGFLQAPVGAAAASVVRPDKDMRVALRDVPNEKLFKGMAKMAAPKSGAGADPDPESEDEYQPPAPVPAADREPLTFFSDLSESDEEVEVETDVSSSSSSDGDAYMNSSDSDDLSPLTMGEDEIYTLVRQRLRAGPVRTGSLLRGFDDQGAVDAGFRQRFRNVIRTHFESVHKGGEHYVSIRGEAHTPAPKRGPGRPRKTQTSQKPKPKPKAAPKRGRGRPKKSATTNGPAAVANGISK